MNMNGICKSDKGQISNSLIPTQGFLRKKKLVSNKEIHSI